MHAPWMLGTFSPPTRVSDPDMHHGTCVGPVLLQRSGGCFTNVSRALQDIPSKLVYCRNRISYENFKLKPCTCAQSPALGTRTKFQLEILTINVISGMIYFREIILESSRNVSETTPRCCRNPFSQWQRSSRWKLHPTALKFYDSVASQQ